MDKIYKIRKKTNRIENETSILVFYIVLNERFSFCCLPTCHNSLFAVVTLSLSIISKYQTPKILKHETRIMIT